MCLYCLSHHLSVKQRFRLYNLIQKHKTSQAIGFQSASTKVELYVSYKIEFSKTHLIMKTIPQKIEVLQREVSFQSYITLLIF